MTTQHDAVYPDDRDSLLDELRIQHLFTRYFDRVDANDPVGASQCMTTDVDFEIMIGERRTGRDRFERAIGRVLDGYTLSSHHASNFTVTFHDDVADVDLYVYAFHRLASTGEPWHLWARAQDTVQRTDSGWLISQHVVLGIDAIPMRHGIPRDWYVPHPGRMDRGSDGAPRMG